MSTNPFTSLVSNANVGLDTSITADIIYTGGEAAFVFVSGSPQTLNATVTDTLGNEYNQSGIKVQDLNNGDMRLLFICRYCLAGATTVTASFSALALSRIIDITTKDGLSESAIAQSGNATDIAITDPWIISSLPMTPTGQPGWVLAMGANSSNQSVTPIGDYTDMGYGGGGGFGVKARVVSARYTALDPIIVSFQQASTPGPHSDILAVTIAEASEITPGSARWFNYLVDIGAFTASAQSQSPFIDVPGPVGILSIPLGWNLPEYAADGSTLLQILYQKIEYGVDGGITWPFVKYIKNGWSTSTMITSIASGTYTLRLTFTDVAGNQSYPVQIMKDAA